MTVWCGPDVSPCFKNLYDAIKAHGSPDVTAPPGRTFTNLQKKGVAERLLREAGFNDVNLWIVDCVWDLDKPPSRLSEIYEKGTVRAAMVLASQPPQSLVAIRQAMTEAVQSRFARRDRWRVPVPAALVRASA